MYKVDPNDPKKSVPKQLVFDNTSGIPVFDTDALLHKFLIQHKEL